MKKEKNKAWYKRWWAIVIFIIISLIIIINMISLVSIIFVSPEQDVKNNLEEDGYEVIFVSMLPSNTAYVEMKSLGNRNDQVWEGIIVLYSYLNQNASEYHIRIIEEKKDCLYNINGDLYRNSLVEGVIGQTAYNQINQKIESESCS